MKNNKLILLIILISLFLPHRVMSMKAVRKVVRYLTSRFTAQQSDDNSLPEALGIVRTSPPVPQELILDDTAPFTAEQSDDNSLSEALDLIKKSPPVPQKLMLDYLDSWEKEQDLAVPRRLFTTPSVEFILKQDMAIVSGVLIDLYGRKKPERVYWRNFCLSPDQTCAAVLAESCKYYNHDSLSLLNFQTGERRVLLNTERSVGGISAIKTVDFSSDGLLLAIGRDTTVQLWNTSDLKLMQELPKHTDPIDRLIFAKKTPMLITAWKDGTIKIWNYVTGTTEATIQNPDKKRFSTLKLSSDDSRLLSTFYDIAALWDVKTGELLGTQQNQGNQDEVFFCPIETNILFFDLEKLRIWNSITHDVHQYNIRRKSNLTGKYNTSTSFSSDGSLAMVLTKKGLQLVNLATKTKSHLLIDADAGFDYDGKYMAGSQFQGSQVISGNDKGMIKFWNTQNGDCTLSLNAHDTPIDDIHFSPDSLFMVSIAKNDKEKPNNAALWSNRKKIIAALIAKEQHEEKNE